MEKSAYSISVFHSLNQVIENCPVTGIQVRTDDIGVKRVKAVETQHGTIETPCVVNCAGLLAFFFKDDKSTNLTQCKAVFMYPATALLM